MHLDILHNFTSSERQQPSEISVSRKIRGSVAQQQYIYIYIIVLYNIVFILFLLLSKFAAEATVEQVLDPRTMQVLSKFLKRGLFATQLHKCASQSAVVGKGVQQILTKKSFGSNQRGTSWVVMYIDSPSLC